MVDFIKQFRKIKSTCSKRQYCRDPEKGNCQFYDKNSGWCVFSDHPELWDIDQINKTLEKEGAKNE